MANIKFSEFTVASAVSDIGFVVGYKDGANVQITPSILLADALGNYLPLAGGTMTGDINLNEGVISKYGANTADLKIYHSTNSFIVNGSTGGNLNIQNFQNSGDITFSATYNNSTKQFMRIDGGANRIIVSEDMNFNSGDKLILNDNLRIYSSGNDSYITELDNLGILYIQAGADLKLQTTAGQDYITCNEGSSVELYFNNLKKLETSIAGVKITDTLDILGDSLNPGFLKLYAPNSANYVGVKGPVNSGGDYTLRLPSALPNVANQILESNASGTLSWIATPGGGGGGVTELNDLTDVELTDFTSALINVPTGGIGSYSFTMGEQAGNSMTTGAQSNTFIGYAAGKSNNGDNHVMIGAHAGENNAATVAFGNVMVGRYAGRGAVGSNAHSTIAIGESALEAVTGGDRNIAIGWHALRRLTTAGTTVAIGNEAGEFITTKSDSVLIGYQAMENANSGQCVVIGAYANDTAVTDFGTGAIHIGYQAGRASTGNRMLNIGWTAGMSQTTGGGVNIGERAGKYNTSSGGRTCVGGYSSEYNTGTSNTFVGQYSGQGISGSSTGGRNTAMGYKAMEDLTTAEYNTVLGYQAGQAISTGSFNTIVGGYSGNPAGKLTTGDYNVLIGLNAVGSSATVDDEVSIYNSNVYARFQGNATAWTFVSDERDKKDIEDLELGLDFVDKLKPRKFKWDLRSSDKYNGKEASGFIAQEIKEILDQSGNDYTGIVNTDDPNQYTVAQANIIPMLVKAIQELKAEIEILKS
tara:strand:- start:298 stop:2565 length:2268 start_codon:yes stop_codon:yes gene_type:complete